MQIVRDRQTLCRFFVRAVVATALIGLAVPSAARADLRDGERSSLMALLEPVEPQTEPVPTLVLERTDRRITSTGHGAPAMMPVRRVDISNEEKSGWSSSMMNMVGTP